MTGLDEERLAEIERRVRETPALAHTQAILVVRHGDSAFERHFRGRGPDEPTDVFPITKRVVSTLVGIALARGRLRSLHHPLPELIPGRAAPAELTLRHLLTMATGRSCDGEWEIDEVMLREDSWVDHLLRAPRLAAPGTVFRYDNGASHVLAAALQRAVGEPLAAFADEHLFRPLGIRDYRWPLDPEGIHYGFGHLALTARDVAKLGQLYLEAGKWRGTQILPRSYVEQATTAHVAGGPPEELPYGFLWWTGAERGHRIFMAAGYAGQFLLVVPDLDLVVVGTGDADALPPGWTSARHVALAGAIAATSSH